jgi:hypothetical protein
MLNDMCVWCVVVRDTKDLRRVLYNSEEQEAVSGVSVCVCVVYRTTLPLFIFIFC